MPETSKRIPIMVDGNAYEIVWQDRVSDMGFSRKLTMLKDGKTIGSKEFHGADTDTGYGVVQWAIRSFIGAPSEFSHLGALNNNTEKGSKTVLK